ncbi:MAG: antibiotic biosynthesis monooxygenase family protein [Pseudomonadota bacterium]
MIVRIFRVEIVPELREEFEQNFASVSIDAVKNQAGFVSATIGKPTKWAPDEYAMVSRWENELALEEFVGASWSQAHIPAGMEKYVLACWVHHYKEFGEA